MDVSKGNSWPVGFHVAGDISDGLIRRREFFFVDHFIRRADVEHFTSALGRPGAVRCPSGTTVLSRRIMTTAAFGIRLRCLCPSSPSGRQGGEAAAESVHRVARNVRDALIEHSCRYILGERLNALAGAIADFTRKQLSG